MKKMFLLVAIAFSLSASAQVDPAFTAKMVDAVDKAEAYYRANSNDKPAALIAATSAISSFAPLTINQFSSKLSAMLNDPVEMAKFSTPTSFVQCLASEAASYYNCLQTAVPPLTPAQCSVGYEDGIIRCAVQHLLD